MENREMSTLEEVRQQLRRFPTPVARRVREGSGARCPGPSTTHRWSSGAEAGVGIAKQTVRSWEAATQYYRVSPKVLSFMPFNYFMQWARCGTDLCKESPTLAAAYFEASPAAMSLLRSRHIESWAKLGSGLYKGTWKSSTLACKFFSYSPALMESLTFPELERFVAFLDALSQRSYDLSTECLALGRQIFPLIGQDKTAFIALASTLLESGWREVKSFFEAGAKALPKIEPDERFRFLKIAERLVQAGGTNIPNVMLETSQALAQVEPGVHARILTLSESLLDESPAAVPEFIKGLRSNHGQAIHRPGRAMVRGGRDPPAAEPRRWTGLLQDRVGPLGVDTGGPIVGHRVGPHQDHHGDVLQGFGGR